MSTAIALAIDFFVTMSRGRMSLRSSSMTCIPACLARRRRAEVTAGIVPLPGRPRPIASVRQFIELAVNIPEQEPQVGQALSSISASSAALIFFALTAPTPSKTEIRSIVLPRWRPASIGPPLMTMAGMFRRSAAMIMPGMILSQLGTSTSASNGCAVTMTSIGVGDQLAARRASTSCRGGSSPGRRRRR